MSNDEKYPINQKRYLKFVQSEKRQKVKPKKADKKGQKDQRHDNVSRHTIKRPFIHLLYVLTLNVVLLVVTLLVVVIVLYVARYQ